MILIGLLLFFERIGGLGNGGKKGEPRCAVPLLF